MRSVNPRSFPLSRRLFRRSQRVDRPHISVSLTPNRKKVRPGSGTWPVGFFQLIVLSLTSIAASAGGHGVRSLLPGVVAQGLEVERERALHQEHQRQDEQRDVPGKRLAG